MILTVSFESPSIAVKTTFPAPVAILRFAPSSRSIFPPVKVRRSPAVLMVTPVPIKSMVGLVPVVVNSVEPSVEKVLAFEALPKVMEVVAALPISTADPLVVPAAPLA